MKSLILALSASAAFATAAQAADAVVYNAPEPAPVVAETLYDWSGFYIGAFGGITTGDFDYSATDGVGSLEASVSGSGFLGGGQIGYDQQFGAFVIGAVADLAVSTHEADVSVTVPGVGTLAAESQLKYLGTVRARAGYALDDLLIYGHGGWAYGETEQTIEVPGATFENDSDMKNGFVVGAGMEWGVTESLSLQAEYSYVDLGEDEVFNDFGVSIDEDVKFHAIKAGINFRF